MSKDGEYVQNGQTNITFFRHTYSISDIKYKSRNVQMH